MDLIGTPNDGTSIPISLPYYDRGTGVPSWGSMQCSWMDKHSMQGRRDGKTSNGYDMTKITYINNVNM